MIRRFIYWYKCWKATIEILCDKETMKEVLIAKEEFARGEGSEWHPNW